MRKRLLISVVMIMGLTFGFTGCDLSKRNVEDQQKTSTTEIKEPSEGVTKEENAKEFSSEEGSSEETASTESTEKESGKKEVESDGPLQVDEDFDVSEELGEDQGVGGK